MMKLCTFFGRNTLCSRLPLIALLSGLWLCTLALSSPRLWAQTENAALSGIIADPTGARVPGAVLTLTNDKTHDVRQGVSNSDGLFNFAAIVPGSYTLRAKLPSFATAIVKAIVLHPADNRALTVTMQIGEVSAEVTVNANDAAPTNGERTSLISASDIEHLSLEGRDVSELVRVQPGFAIGPVNGNDGLANGAYDPGQVTVGGGLSNFAANGAPASGINVTVNGADITDPTSGNSTTQNINQEMVQEVQIQTSAFGADQAKGPIVVNAVTKSGGAEYHGEVYTYFRSHALNTQNWFSKNLGLPDAQDLDAYPGGQFGGPVMLPFTNLNRASKRLRFFVGAEDYTQHSVYSYGNVLNSSVFALVPTANMRTGNFSAPEIANYLGTDVATLATQCNPNPTSTLSNYVHLCGVPTGVTNTGAIVTNGIIPAGGMDPGATALLNALPLPNRPTIGGYNYADTNFENNDLWQVVTRVDDDVSEKFKFYVTYGAEKNRNSQIPETQTYSAANGGPSMGGVDTPGKGATNLFTQSLSFNSTYVFTPSLTNEAYISAALNRNNFNLLHPGQLSKTANNYPYSGIYPTASQQIPQFGDYSYDGLPIALYPDVSAGPLFQHTFTPTFGDNVSMSVRSHTLKFGVYVQRAVSNTTVSTPETNGLITQYYIPNGTKITNPDGSTGNTLSSSVNYSSTTFNPTTTCPITGTGAGTPPTYAYTCQEGNYLADFAIGDVTQFFQQNFQTNLDLYYWTTDFYAADTWRTTRKLTLTLGMRFEHLGAWQDMHGNGIAIFSPEIYNNPVSQEFPGLDWHGIDKSVPNSGAPERLFFYSPRFGIAYDLYGNGSTVFHGGFGLYRSHDSGNDYAQAAATAQGAFVTTVGGSGVQLSKLSQGATSLSDCTNHTLPNAQSHCPSLNAIVYGLDRKDDEQPLTYTYNFTVTQVMPLKTIFEIAYVGSLSHDLLLPGGGALGSGQQSLQNVNALPVGALFVPDPLTGTFILPQSLSTAQQGDFRPYKPYLAVDVIRHFAYSNYNALQTSLNRTAGAVRLGLNYTWSKSLGIRQVTGQLGDPIYLRNNYGPLASDRSQIANATYSMELGTHHLAMHPRLGVAVNGWSVSGITSFQSGPNLQSVYSDNFKLKGAVGSNTVQSITYLGTPEVSLQPNLTCNPAQNLKQRQYVNGACFSLPTIGTQNGTFSFPYLHGPAYFDTDLTLVKNFALNGSKGLQFRLAGFNFLNHPITSFSGRFPQEANLYFTGTGTGTPSLVTPPTTNCSVIDSPCFGYAGYKQGRRVVELTAKFTF